MPSVPLPGPLRVAQPWISLLVRLVLGVVWIVAALQKLPDPAGFVRAVRAYQVVPEWLAHGIGYGLPVFELAVGIALVLGIGTRMVAAISGLLFLVFLIGIISASARGLQLECGCFGGGGSLQQGQHTTYTLDIVRDVALLIGAAWLVLWPASRFALDEVVRRGAPSHHRSERVGPRRTKEAQRRLAELQAKHEREARMRQLTTSGVVAIVLVAVGFAGIGIQAHRAKVSGPLVVPSSAVNNAIVVGKTSAPVTVDLYEDFICPACGAFEKQDAATVTKLATTGKAKFSYHVLGFLDRNSSPAGYSTRAANAAACAADSAAFEKFHALLYANQPAEGSPGLSNAQLVAYGKKAGATGPGFASCVNDGTYKRWIGKITDIASKDGIGHTPTIAIDGKEITGAGGGAPNPTELTNAITAAAKKAKPSTK